MTISNNHEEEMIVDTPPLDHLVDREDQLRLFESTLRSIREGESEKRFLVWTGSPGIGKTQLIRLLRKKICASQGVPNVLLDFSAVEARRWGDDPTSLLLYTADKLEADVEQLSQKIEAFQEKVQEEVPREERVLEAYLRLPRKDRLYSRPEWLVRLQTVRDEFLTTLERKLQGHHGATPVVLFFDETEYADPELVKWLEEWVLSQFMQAGYYVVVWTARRQHSWSRPEVQRNTRHEQLEPFGEEQVRLQFEASTLAPRLVEELFEKVFPLIGGHPAANAVAIVEGEREVTEPSEPSLEQALLKKIYKQFIFGRVLYGLRPEEKLACELLSLVRFFDSSVLKRILLRFDANLFTEWSDRDFRILFDRLRQTQLLVWDSGFAIDPDFRGIIRDYFRVCKPEIFEEINEEVVEVYEGWLDRPVDSRNFFVIELLYHLASLRQVGRRVSLAPALREQLSRYENIGDEEALRLAVEKLAGEIENNTSEWLTERQRQILLKEIRAFEIKNRADNSKTLLGAQ